ncbi:MAG: VWA domain-containing protein [Pyrinomonadaceae bacterium]|nr:VWA domain-containing protein [Pyrinomonadaceae bacterium]
MKKSFACLFFLSLFMTAGVNPLTAQTRQRRVGQNPTPSAPNASTPSRAPVLGGTVTTAGQPGVQSPAINSGPEEVEAGDVIRVETTLVTLPVSVTDRNGRYVPNLVREDFRLWEDGLEQQVAFFASVDKPFSVVLMIDTSGSTRFRIQEIQDAAITFVNQLRPDDQVMVVSFDDDVKILTEFTGDRGRLRDAIRRTRTGDGTKLYDAVDLVINQRLNRESGRKAVVLFTDGVDTTSRRASYASNVRDAEEADALIYPVQYDTYSDVNSGGSTWPGTRRAPTSPVDILIQILGGMGGGRGGRSGGGGGGIGSSRTDYEQANRYLRDLAERTGARQFQADSTSNLAIAFSNVAEELRRQYSLGFYPKRPPQQGQRRQVRVRVNQPNLAVRARDSYIFDGPGSASQDRTAQKPAPVLRRKLAEVPVQKRS